jgi:hypothetical protein
VALLGQVLRHRLTIIAYPDASAIAAGGRGAICRALRFHG